MSDIGEQMMRPIIGIEYRTAQEAFDIMCERFRSSAVAIVPFIGGIYALFIQ